MWTVHVWHLCIIYKPPFILFSCAFCSVRVSANFYHEGCCCFLLSYSPQKYNDKQILVMKCNEYNAAEGIEMWVGRRCRIVWMDRKQNKSVHINMNMFARWHLPPPPPNSMESLHNLYYCKIVSSNNMD